MTIEKKGMMFILSSPSGTGKTTLAKKLAQNNNNFSISISHTTRKPRPNEINGKDYYFVSRQEFEDLIADKVIIQALREVIGEGFTPLQGKIAAIADGMNAFRNTASSTLTDVIMGTKKLNEALGEIVNQTLRALIQGFINLGISIFILEPLERWLRKQVQGQQQLNNQLRKTLALETAIAAVKGVGSMFGIPFFADGGRTAANQRSRTKETRQQA